MDIKRLPQRESLVHHRQLIYQLKFSFQKVSVHRNEQNGQEEYIKSHEDKLCLPRSVHGVSVM